MHNLNARLFSEKVDRSAGKDACWPWTASRTKNGYGQFSGRDENMKPAIFRAHRVAYFFACGPIPAGMSVMHTCDNRACCNPAHLRLGSQGDNMRDMVAKGRQARGYKSPLRQGQKHHNSKLTDAEADLIRASTESGAALAKRFLVSAATVSMIRSGARRQH
jgi:hypothetical protein